MVPPPELYAEFTRKNNDREILRLQLLTHNKKWAEKRISNAGKNIVICKTRMQREFRSAKNPAMKINVWECGGSLSFW